MSANYPEKRGNSDWVSWALIIVLFGVGIWPIALILLFTKLFGGDGGRRRTGARSTQQDTKIPYREEGDVTGTGRTEWQGERYAEKMERQAAHYAEKAEQYAAQYAEKAERHADRYAEKAARHADRYAERAERHAGRAENIARQVVRTPSLKSSNARWLKFMGILLVIGGLVMSADPAQALYVQGVLSRSEIWQLLQHLAVAVAGGGLFFAGRNMERSMKRYQKYLSVMGSCQSMPLDQIARKLGYSRRRVEKDLRKMIDKDYFGESAYLNLELGYFFRSGQADVEQEEEPAEETPRETDEGYSGILRNIRRLNDLIADPVLSAKISRLEEITAKIFKAVEDDPRKKNRIDTFLNYYLPTTQKLLNSYAEFEAAGVQGENLQQAKERIESTMDSIVAGFEHQLDEMYKDDVLDVDSDIRVMETMLNRDTASVEKDFGLGRTRCAEPGKSVPSAPSAPRKSDVDLGGTAAQKMEEAD